MNKLPLLTCLTLTCAASLCNWSVAGGSGPLTLDQLERMTPAQIGHLSQDQIDAVVGMDADAALTKLLLATIKIDAAHPGPIWPDSSNTLHFAAEVAYEGWYFDPVYKKDPGPDLRSSGCAFPVAAAYQKTFADTACRHQNYGYRNVPQYRYTHNEAARQAIDIRFLMDMHTQCLDMTSKASQHACDLAAVAAYVQARRNGKAAFDAVTARYP
ncbi:phospholipase A2 [Deinococcus sp.]|uniref:phospholipase A2 n=1 Tax=Deinococcus sp. TaxID=47478 RepID=UPI003CC62489